MWFTSPVKKFLMLFKKFMFGPPRSEHPAYRSQGLGSG